MVDVEGYESLVEELALLRDVHRGLADVEAGRVIPHDEVRALPRIPLFRSADPTLAERVDELLDGFGER